MALKFAIKSEVQIGDLLTRPHSQRLYGATAFTGWRQRRTSFLLLLISIKCLGQNSLTVLNIYNGVITDINMPSNDSNLYIENDQSSTIFFNKESLIYSGSRYRKNILHIKKQIRWKGYSLLYNVNSINLLDFYGKDIYKIDKLSSQLYSFDLNDSFIVLNSEEDITLINYIQGTSRTIKNLPKNNWFVKIIDNSLLYIDLQGKLISLNIYNGNKLVLNKIAAPPEEIRCYRKNSKEFFLYSQDYTYCYKNYKIKKIIFNSEHYLSKLLVTANKEYFYDSSSVSIIVKEMRNKKAHIYKIATVMINQAHNYELDTLISDFSDIVNMNMIFAKPNKWVLSHDSLYLAGFTFNGKVLIFKLDKDIFIRQ